MPWDRRLYRNRSRFAQKPADIFYRWTCAPLIEGRAFAGQYFVPLSSHRFFQSTAQPFFAVEHDQVTYYGRVIAEKNSTTSTRVFRAIAYRVRDIQLRFSIGTDAFVDLRKVCNSFAMCAYICTSSKDEVAAERGRRFKGAALPEFISCDSKTLRHKTAVIYTRQTRVATPPLRRPSDINREITVGREKCNISTARTTKCSSAIRLGLIISHQMK